jgi:uncharacterized membrane protein YkgB
VLQQEGKGESLDLPFHGEVISSLASSIWGRRIAFATSSPKQWLKMVVAALVLRLLSHYNFRAGNNLIRHEHYMNVAETYHRVDRTLTQVFARFGITALRISLAIVFLWFGALKFFPGLSSAESLAIETTRVLSSGLVHDRLAILLVASLETIIGIGLLFGIALRATLFLLAMQMLGTLAPLVIFPHLTFVSFPWVPTLEGQYILKNAVIISAALVVGATVRGGGLVSEPIRR